MSAKQINQYIVTISRELEVRSYSNMPEGPACHDGGQGYRGWTKLFEKEELKE